MELGRDVGLRNPSGSAHSSSACRRRERPAKLDLLGDGQHNGTDLGKTADYCEAMARKDQEFETPQLRMFQFGEQGLEAMFVIPRFPDWRASFTWEHGTHTLREVRVFPGAERTPSGGITTALLRAVPLAGAARSLARNRDVGPPLAALFGESAMKEFSQVPRPGRKGRNDSFYLEWAVRYLSWCERSSRPVADLAREVSFSPQTVSGFVREARERDLLTWPPRRGVAGGELTIKAQRLLESRMHNSLPERQQ